MHRLTGKTIDIQVSEINEDRVLVWAGVDGLKVNPDARLSHPSLTRILAEYGGRKVLLSP